jgi:hypothetical protein
MSDRKPSNEGYQPNVTELIKKGYQPTFDTPHRPTPGSGYQPVGTGDNPTNAPSAPANVPSPPTEL